MPTYDYRCQQCEHQFSALHKIADPAPSCPNCGGSVRKELSAPAVHGAGSANKTASTTTPAAPVHGCGAGGCGHRH